MQIENTDYSIVMNGLSKIIQAYLCRGASEQYAPSGDSDRSDHLIADSLLRATRMRKLREEFEEIFAGALMDGFRDPKAPLPVPRQP